MGTSAWAFLLKLANQRHLHTCGLHFASFVQINIQVQYFLGGYFSLRCPMGQYFCNLRNSVNLRDGLTATCGTVLTYGTVLIYGTVLL